MNDSGSIPFEGGRGFLFSKTRQITYFLRIPVGSTFNMGCTLHFFMTFSEELTRKLKKNKRIKSLFSWWSFPLFPRHQCVILG